MEFLILTSLFIYSVKSEMQIKQKDNPISAIMSSLIHSTGAEAFALKLSYIKDILINLSWSKRIITKSQYIT
jgi:hypothetical protein